MSGYAVTTPSALEIIAAWVAPKTIVPAVASGTGWYSIGEYWLPLDCRARLDAILSVSDSSLIGTVRLWDTTANTAVRGEVATNSTDTIRKLGIAINLTGQRRYQVQAQCVGGTGTTKFAVIETATISE